MTSRGREVASAACFALATLLSAEARAELVPPGSSPDQEIFNYTVREGDTCEGIARRIYGHGRYYYIIIDYNPGPTNVLRTTCDRFLSPGMELRLPRRIPQSRLDPDATVTAVVKQVRSRPPAAEQWRKARPGQSLFRGWRVNTLDRSEAQLTFRDDSVVQLREKSLIVIYGPSAGDARRSTSKATLERGTLRAHLGELSGRTRLKVETPSARASLNGGEAVVSVDEEETSRVSNHTGRAAQVVNRRGGNEVIVSAGMGTTVRRGKRPTPPRPLLPAPRWVETHPRLFISLGQDMDSVVSGAWRPVPGAVHYRVELSSGADGDIPVGSTGVPGTVDQFELHRFPPGTYHVTVSAIDGEGLESPPSHTRVVELVGLELVPPSFARSSIEQSGERPRVMAGTKLMTPEGLTCSTGEGEPSRELVFSGRGVVSVSCRSADGNTAPRMLVDVVPIELRPSTSSSASGVTQLSRGDEVTVVLDGIDVSDLPPSNIAAVGGPGLRVDDVAPDPGGGLRVTVTAAADAPPETFVELQLRRRGERRVVLGRVRFGVGAPLSPHAEEPEAPPPSVEAGPTEPRLRALTEGFALVVGPSAFGARDERRRGSGLWTALAYETSFGNRPSRLSPALGVRLAAFGELLRLDLGVPIPVQARPGGFALSASSRIIAGELVGAAVDLSAWLPFGRDESTDRYTLRLVPSVDLSFRVHERVALRTRQGLMADASQGGLLAWASAYAVDVWIVGPLTLGADATLVLGAMDGALLAAPAAGLTAGLEVGPLAFAVSLRYAFTSDAEALFGRLGVVVEMRSAGFTP